MHSFKKVKICLRTKFQWDISIHGWDKTTSGFGKRTAVILELYFRFRFLSVRSYRDVILHPPAKFCSNPTIGDGVMTSYRFFKMTVIESEIYFRFRFWWWYSFGKMEIYWHTKFQWHISVHGWDKTTSGFGKRTAAILDFYFRFIFLLNFRHRRVILHWPTIFRQNRTTLGGVMTSYRFFSERELMFTFAICRRPSVCLSSVCL